MLGGAKLPELLQQSCSTPDQPIVLSFSVFESLSVCSPFEGHIVPERSGAWLCNSTSLDHQATELLRTLVRGCEQVFTYGMDQT